MNIKLHFYRQCTPFFLIVKKKFVPSVEKQNRAKQSTVAGGCGYPRHPGRSLGEDYSHQGVSILFYGLRLSACLLPVCVQARTGRPFLCIKPVVVVSKANLGYVERSGLAPLTHIYPHIHCPHNPLYFTCRLTIQSFFDRRKHIRPGILKV